MGVGQRLKCRERLGADDEKCLLGIEVTRGFVEVGAINVGDEAEGHIAPAVMTQRLVGHYRAQIRATDADVNDVADRPIRVSTPAAAADCFGESRHAVEDRTDLGHDVDAVAKNPLVFRRAQGDMENGALLGHVDFLTAEHRFDALGQTAFMSQA